jgi:hypothetical protein
VPGIGLRAVLGALEKVVVKLAFMAERNSVVPSTSKIMGKPCSTVDSEGNANVQLIHFF